MLIIWIVIAVAAAVLLVKFRAVWELRKQDGGYADGDAGERREEMKNDAAYAQTEAESQNAQGMAEENTSLWL